VCVDTFALQCGSRTLVHTAVERRVQADMMDEQMDVHVGQ